MATFNRIRQDRSRFTKLALFALAFLLLLGILGVYALTAEPAEAAKRVKACTGTYLIEFAFETTPLSMAIWTLNADGTFQGTDSAEDDAVRGGFSHHQGVWEAFGNGQVKVSALDFTTDDVGPAMLMARIDSIISSVDGCSTISVVSTVEVFDVANGQDPLVPTSGIYSFVNEGTGRVVTVQ